MLIWLPFSEVSQGMVLEILILWVYYNCGYDPEEEDGLALDSGPLSCAVTCGLQGAGCWVSYRLYFQCVRHVAKQRVGCGGNVPTRDAALQMGNDLQVLSQRLLHD